MPPDNPKDLAKRQRDIEKQRLNDIGTLTGIVRQLLVKPVLNEDYIKSNMPISYASPSYNGDISLRLGMVTKIEGLGRIKRAYYTKINSHDGALYITLNPRLDITNIGLDLTCRIIYTNQSKDSEKITLNYENGVFYMGSEGKFAVLSPPQIFSNGLKSKSDPNIIEQSLTDKRWDLKLKIPGGPEGVFSALGYRQIEDSVYRSILDIVNRQTRQEKTIQSQE